MSTWRAYVLLIVWAAILFGLSSIPGPSLPNAATIFGLDKVTHALLYGVFGFLCAYGSTRRLPHLGRMAVLGLATAAATAYGLSDEIHQIFVPGRSADWHDLVADSAGGLLGALIFDIGKRLRAR